PQALEIADTLDQERAAGAVRGPLHGIPIVLKDNIDTADQMQTTAGSLALLGAMVAHDAPVVVKLRQAGAVVLGKANMSEWANVGIKPTVGLTSRQGVIPISHTQDTVGPHARTVADAATLLSAIAESGLDYRDFLDAGGLKGARIGVAREFHTGYSEHTDRVF